MAKIEPANITRHSLHLFTFCVAENHTSHAMPVKIYCHQICHQVS